MDEQNKPNARKKRIVGAGKGIEKKGEGLGTGPVGQSGAQPPQSAFTQKPVQHAQTAPKPQASSQNAAQRPVQNFGQSTQRPSQSFGQSAQRPVQPFGQNAQRPGQIPSGQSGFQSGQNPFGVLSRLSSGRRKALSGPQLPRHKAPRDPRASGAAQPQAAGAARSFCCWSRLQSCFSLAGISSAATAAEMIPG